MEILETNCTDNQPNTFALRSPKAIHLATPRGTWGNFEETRGGAETVVCWSTKAAVSLKRVNL